MDTSTHGSTRSSAEVVRLYLQQQGGPVEVLLFDHQEITIGREGGGGGARPVLTIADRCVSRRHAAILVGPERLLLEDRGGQAGVFVNGRRIRGRCVIAPGERFTFAGYTAWIERPHRSPAGTEARRSSSGHSEGGGRRSSAGAEMPSRWSPERSLEVGEGPEAWRGPSGGHVESSADGAGRRSFERSSKSSPKRTPRRAPKRAPFGPFGRSEAAHGAAEAIEGATGPTEARALDWIRGGEPVGLLLRGRELRRAREWLRSHPATAPGDPRRRWIERSEAARSRRSRGRGVVGFAVATALGAGVLLGLRELPAAEEHPQTATCKRAELAKLQRWLDEDPASLRRSALALAWAQEMGCRSAQIEGVAHQALARTPAEKLAELPSAGSSRLVPVGGGGGGGGALLIGPKATLYLGGDGLPAPIGGAGGEWRSSGDGRWAAEISATRRDLQLWALDGGPRSLSTLRLDEPIIAAALDQAGLELWIASGGRLRRWRRQAEVWIEAEGRDDGLGITTSDRVSVGLGGVVVDRGASLWWLPAGSKRAQLLGDDVELWTLVDRGESLVTAVGGVVRRWRVHRRRLRGEVLVELAEPVLQLASVADSGEGAELAVATTAELLLVDVHQRWRRGQALSRALIRGRAGRGILSLVSDPEGRRLAAIDPSGATLWDLGGEAQRSPIAEFAWRSRRPEGVALVGDALLTASKGRLERWPLVGVEGGLDGVAVDLGEATRTLAIDPEGRRIAAGGDSAARSWARVDGATRWSLVTSLELDEPVTAMAFADDGAWVVAHGDTLEVHRLASGGQPVKTARTTMGAPVESLAVADRGRWILATDAGGGLMGVPAGDSGGSPRSWSLGATATALAASPGGTQVLVGDYRGGVQSLRVGGSAGVRALPEHDGEVLAVAVSRGGAWLASSGEDRRLQLLTAEGALRSSTTQPAAVDSLVFLGEGWLAARDRQGRVSLHATGESRELVLGVRPGPAAGLLAGGPERLYVLAENGAIELWDLRLGGGRPRLASVTQIAAGGDPGARMWRIDQEGERLLSADRAGILRVRPLGIGPLVEALCGLQRSGGALDGPVPAEFAATLCE